MNNGAAGSLKHEKKMNTSEYLLGICFIDVVCKALLIILTTVSVHAVAAPPTTLQVSEFEGYISSIYAQTAHSPADGGWANFQTSHSYVRAQILGYTVPKKAVENGRSFVAHGIMVYRSSRPSLTQRSIYRFDGDGSYWVVYLPTGSRSRPRITSLAEYVSIRATKATKFIVETVGENAIRKWTPGLDGNIEWEASSPSPQEAMDVYNHRVFFNPPGSSPLDIETGDPSLRPVASLVIDDMEVEIDQLELLDVNVETALRKTMILNKQLQLRHNPSIHSTHTGLFKELRDELFTLGPEEVNYTYGLLRDVLPRGGDYEFPPGCAGD